MDEVSESLHQSGEFQQYSVNRLKSQLNLKQMILQGTIGSDPAFRQQPILNGDLPEHFTESFKLLKKFIDESLDIYNDELQSVLFPIFTELFLGMVKGKFLKEARKFFADERYQF